LIWYFSETMSDDLQDEFIPDPVTEEELRREAELEALRQKITEEDPGYWDRVVDRVNPELKAEGGSRATSAALVLPVSTIRRISAH
jgi:hypothetical protein